MTQAGFPHYTKEAQKGNKGVRIVENIVHDQFRWIFREQEGQKDFGIDAHIELMDEDKVLGRMLAAQIKCGKSFFRRKNRDGYIFNGEQKHLNYFLNYPLPVLIILCDPDSEKCWWCEVEPRQMEYTEKGWEITIPFNQTFDLGAKNLLIELAGPAKDYIPELQHYWRMNRLLEKNDLLCMVIPKEDIESGDLSNALTILNRIRVKKKMARHFRDKVDISIFGYQDDPRELFELPEVRKWVRKLDREFPYWFFFLSKEMPGLLFITYALCKYSKLPEGGFELNGESLSKFVLAHFGPMNEICISVDYSEKEIKELSKSVISYYSGGELPPSWDTM